MTASDTVTRNLVLQVPGSDASHVGDYCTLGSGVRLGPGSGSSGTSSDQCEDLCSRHGVCLRGETLLDTHMAVVSCFCDVGWWGPTCSDSTNTACNSGILHYELPLLLGDTYGDGWTLSRYSITSTTTADTDSASTNANTGAAGSGAAAAAGSSRVGVVDYAFDSLCNGKLQQRSYVPPSSLFRCFCFCLCLSLSNTH